MNGREWLIVLAWFLFGCALLIVLHAGRLL